MDAIDCANKLADYAIKNEVDGVDVDWEDTAAFNDITMKGQQWLSNLTKQLRSRLPNAIITHAPQGPYFAGKSIYKGGGYVKVQEEVGKDIQFYNIQFYNQGSTPYSTP